MPTVAVTTDALELMVQQAALVREFIDAIKGFREDLEEFKKSIRKAALLTTEEAAEYIGVKATTLEQYRTTGQINDQTPMPAYVKIGNLVRYEKTELDHWIREDLPRFRGKKGG